MHNIGSKRACKCYLWTTMIIYSYNQTSDLKYICYAFLFIHIILYTQYCTYLIKITHWEDGKHIPQMLKTWDWHTAICQFKFNLRIHFVIPFQFFTFRILLKYAKYTAEFTVNIKIC